MARRCLVSSQVKKRHEKTQKTIAILECGCLTSERYAASRRREMQRQWDYVIGRARSQKSTAPFMLAQQRSSICSATESALAEMFADSKRDQAAGVEPTWQRKPFEICDIDA